MKKILTIIAALIGISLPAVCQAPATSSLTAEEIISRMFARDKVREREAGGFVGGREYTLENKKLGKRASMVVAVFIDSDGSKHFQIVSEDGWKGANKHVLRKMLESESESSVATTRPKTRIIPENYDFSLVGSEALAGRPSYVIEANPKRSDKYLFRGRIWVDAEDYALARVQGAPAKNPSFWTRKVDFVQEYHKAGEFWYPTSTKSVTDAMIFGTTDVSIRYFDYKPACTVAESGKFMEAHYVQH